MAIKMKCKIFGVSMAKNCMRKILLLTILSVVSFCFLSNSFAQSSNDDLQQRMVRLQQILTKIQQQGGKKTEEKAVGALPSPPAAVAAATAGQSDNSALLQPTTEQQAAANTNVPPASETQQDLYEDAFTGVVDQMLPMSPEQIANLRDAFNSSQKASATPPGIPPRPTSSSVIVNLAPQATPPIVRLQAGYITSLVFMDSTGQPWPISAYSLGDPTAFNIQWDRKGNTLLVQAVTFYKRSNIAVMLKDLNTPVMLTLLPGQEAVDYRVDFRVPGLGPNAVFVQNGLPDSINPILVDVLNGIKPQNSKTLKVVGGNCQAWLLNKTLFLRTNLNVISPGWKSIITSMDGTHAYELQPSPVILTSVHGKNVTLMIEGLE